MQVLPKHLPRLFSGDNLPSTPVDFSDLRCMFVLSAAQIRNWDQFTIEHEPISSLDLMERAARSCFNWLCEHQYSENNFVIFCGKGNNGGDGLAIARMLAERGTRVDACILEFGNLGTPDFQANLERLHHYPLVTIRYLQDETHFPLLSDSQVIIDALFGSGLSRPLEGFTKKLVEHINESGCEIIAIDIPSGLSVDQTSKHNTAIKATHTLSFQCYKLALLVPENGNFTGSVHILDIGLSQDYLKEISGSPIVIDAGVARKIFRPRNRFAHKGNFGHALLIAGSYGKIGAAVLASKSCLRSGAGLLTVHIPKCGYEIMQTSVHEAMVETDFNTSYLTSIPDQPKIFDAIGIGPGLGTAVETRKAIEGLFSNFNTPLVIDADALNCMAIEKQLLKRIPINSILTPHPKEFERLFGETKNDFERIELSRSISEKHGLIIILKGHHTMVTTPQGEIYFNTTGNPGMATAGSGDVLTGMLTGILAQGYTSVEASLLAVFLHGRCGDLALGQQSYESMIAGDIIDNIGEAFRELSVEPGNSPHS